MDFVTNTKIKIKALMTVSLSAHQSFQFTEKTSSVVKGQLTDKYIVIVLIVVIVLILIVHIQFLTI